ncbi:DUF3857 domain-containing protein [Siphonobacter sp. SORGH_AS_1065]|uniref:DUF3857 domain-containing protein n=1 Tax=Siphonobacter sp. SORGH_AS_1065 TaxID=3041795 RepID=UPI00277E97C7|nr:DUF3857 domain-containing protein [Siphonobacter sp. SORGH_AS_1065]MDQ1088693.1 hypothetical protein [Siphonobacter sp. SORGH_AS_1065]
MKRVLFLLLLFPLSLFAQTYSVESIPADLRNEASAVIRLQEESFEVLAVGEAVKRIHTVVTILNEKGDKYATEEVYYDKLSRVKNFEGKLYDANGKEIKRLRKSDILDVSSHSDYSLFDDNKVKQADFKYANYPFTVEFDYELVSYNTLFYPYWIPQRDEELAIENSAFTVIVPATLGLRFREMNGVGAVQKSEKDGIQTYQWQVKNLKIREEEPYVDFYASCGPAVLTAPNQFDMKGNKGSAASWKELGQFFYDLNVNRDELPEPAKANVLKVVGTETDPLRKVEKLYQYLQQSTRYVSIQLGVGGWQSIPAATVVEKGYGDCKALSNYMKAMLKVAGVTSYTASVSASSIDVLTDFPSARFNHEILCVPLAKDTLWLECTSQHADPGYMGSFTGNRHALLETPQGGVLVKTPSYQQAENGQYRTIEVFLDKEGNATTKMLTHYSGIQHDDYRSATESMAGETLKRWKIQRMRLASFDLNDFAFEVGKPVKRIPSITEKLSLTVRKSATMSGNRMFLSVNQYTPWTLIPKTLSNRQHEVVWTVGFTDADTVTYHIPESYTLEALPEPVKLETEFGTYTAQTVKKGETIVYTRRLEMPRFRKPASAYPKFVDFCKKIARADRSQAVFVKQ